MLVAGAAAPKLVTRDMVRKMKPGAVMVDISIDQGGCFETSRPTTHADPTFVVDGVVHYCVTNMPGAVPRTSTFALTNATLPYVKALADHGVEQALALDPHLAHGLERARRARSRTKPSRAIWDCRIARTRRANAAGLPDSSSRCFFLTPLARAPAGFFFALPLAGLIARSRILARCSTA